MDEDQDNMKKKGFKKFCQCRTYEEYSTQFTEKTEEDEEAKAKAKEEEVAAAKTQMLITQDRIRKTQMLMDAKRKLQAAEEFSKSVSKFYCNRCNSMLIKLRILLATGEERVVTTFFPLPPNCVILDEVACSHCNNRHPLSSKEVKPRKKSPILSAAEKKLDIYKRVSDDNTWKAPPSTHKLLQEEHSYDPWRVLVICKLLNLTQGKQARKVLTKLFDLIPNAEAATNVSEESIREVIRPLGLYNKRAIDIKILSAQYLSTQWTHVPQLHGVGKYAADAYALFCVGNAEDVKPWDHKLVDYWKFLCEMHARQN